MTNNRLKSYWEHREDHQATGPSGLLPLQLQDRARLLQIELTNMELLTESGGYILDRPEVRYEVSIQQKYLLRDKTRDIFRCSWSHMCSGRASIQSFAQFARSCSRLLADKEFCRPVQYPALELRRYSLVVLSGNESDVYAVFLRKRRFSLPFFRKEKRLLDLVFSRPDFESFLWSAGRIA